MISKYLDCYISTETCNFRCPYCYITQRRTYSKKIFRLNHSPKMVRKALSKERLGGISLINLCAGGETLLSPDVIPVAKELVDEGHYVMIVTNGSLTKRFEEIRDTFDERERAHLFFKFSFHFSELKRLNLMDRYFQNINMMRDAGCSFTCEVTPCDDFIPHIDEIKSICEKEIGAAPHITIARNDTTSDICHLSSLNWDEYKRTWGGSSELFKFKEKIYYQKRNEFCYAGAWTLFIDLAGGAYRPCNCGPILGNIYTNQKINFRAIGKCELPHCFNGHSWIVLGAIPGFTEITYANERDREEKNGAHWLTDEYIKVFSSKLENQNKEYSVAEKKKAILYSRLKKIEIYILRRWRWILKHLKTKE